MPEPLFTASRGWAMVETTPGHVKAELDGLVPREDSDVMDLGTVVHGMALTGESNVVLVNAPDWRTKAAKEAKAAARAEGMTPLLPHTWEKAKAMVKALREQLDRHAPPTPFVGGYAEQSIYVTLDGVECRCTPDWVYRDYTVIRELKTTGASAHPAAFAKTIWGNGYAFQLALYKRAVKAKYGTDPDAAWVVQETYPPYALSMVAMDPEAESFADSQVTEALRLWKLCRDTGNWPGYPTRTAYAEVPGWAMTQWAERSYYEEASR